MTSLKPKKPAPKKAASKPRSDETTTSASKPAAKAASDRATTSQNPRGGEGDYESAERYQREAQAFAQSGRVESAATAAREAVESDEADELEEAEAEGRSRAKEVDR